MKGFDSLAPFYDLLASVVFLGQIDRAQKHLVNQIKPNSRVLILGGGTGKLLTYFHKNTSIKFVEISSKMISKAKKRKTEAFVEFEESDFLEWSSIETFDYIICPFFLDLFSSIRLKEIITKTKTYLKDNGQLLVSDFDGASKSFFNQLLLKLMFGFFFAVGAINIKKYNHLFKNIEDQFLSIDNEKRFFHNFIKTASYRK